MIMCRRSCAVKGCEAGLRSEDLVLLKGVRKDSGQTRGRNLPCLFSPQFHLPVTNSAGILVCLLFFVKKKFILLTEHIQR